MNKTHITPAQTNPARQTNTQSHLTTEFDFDKSQLIADHNINGADAELVRNMNTHEVALLSGWLSFYPMAEDGVRDTLFAATRYHEGCFENKAAYAVAALRKHDVPESIIDILVEHSAKNIDTDMLEVAVAAGGNEDDLNMLFDHNNLTALGESLSSGSFEHNNHYFEM